ncbi:MAG: hypothetical protein L3K14_09645 [Thermoplasmata archaeon]|nr:hypothetical protein [Thermoplasmata archaeon]
MEPRERTRLHARDWFRGFREMYDSSAGSLLTELGLFYDRHRKFVQFGQRSDPKNPEYTDEEWNRVMTTLFGQMAEGRGLIQAPDREDRPQLVWYLPGVTDRPTVIIRAASDATDAILTRDLPDLSRSGAELAVFLMYPDYPLPEGTSTIDEATSAWESRLSRRLEELQARHEVLTLTISAYSFDLPAPWRAFLWDPDSRSLQEAK